MRTKQNTGQKWLLRTCWLILVLAVRCSPTETTAVVPPHIVAFEVSDPAAMAGNNINLSWQTEAGAAVTLEVWGFVSYSSPQIQLLASHANLPSVGTQTITMPAAPSAVYLIVDPFVGRDQSPNATRQLVPTYYQPDVQRFEVSTATPHPGDSVLVEWETDSVFPLYIKTFFVYETQDRSWIEPAQQFDELPPSGSLTVTVPDSESDLKRLSYELYYRNQDYTRQISQLFVEIIQN